MKKEPITKTTLDSFNSNDAYVSTDATAKQLSGKPLPQTVFVSSNKTELKDYDNKRNLEPKTELEAQKIVLEDVVKTTVDHPKELKPKQNEQAASIMILRSHFVRDILKNLEKIQAYAQKPLASMYVSNIIKSSRNLFAKNSSDPFIEIIMALHDALIYDSSWASYSALQYKTAYQIIKKTAIDSRLNSKKVEKAIIALSNAGFDILPFDLGI